MRIGCLGGTFDPVHEGHLAMAKKALKELQLDQIWFIPALITPLKDRVLTPFEIRTEMLKKALKPYRKFKLCLVERDLPTPSYTVNTVEVLKKQFPEHEFTWIIGDDQVRNFDQWKDPDRLLSMIRFAVISRHGVTERRQGFVYLENFTHPASSTLVRQGKFIYVPKAVRNVIWKYGLYVDDIARAHCNPHRYQHCCSMTQMALELAEAHGIDPVKTRIAGMLHDMAKGLDEKQSEEWMRVYCPDQMDQSWKIWHQYIAPVMMKTQLYCYDHQILNAVRFHTTGTCMDPLARIIFIADKIDPGRGYDITRQKAACLKDLDAGFKLVKNEQIAYLRKEGFHV